MEAGKVLKHLNTRTPKHFNREPILRAFCKSYLLENCGYACFKKLGSALRGVPYIGRVDANLLEAVFGFASDSEHVLRLQQVEECLEQRCKAGDFAVARVADREALIALVGVKRNAIPSKEVREVGLHHAPIDLRAVLVMGRFGETGGMPHDGEGRVNQLGLAHQGDAREAAPPRPRGFGEQKNGRRFYIAREVVAQVGSAQRHGLGMVQVFCPIAVGVE